ncbi:MAG: phosphoadenylyl-sulfate reductase [Betaproteobacteria bacterium]|nr:phosphoadenylyl-sulfate reductase [Betaproteobacteria bacterium]
MKSTISVDVPERSAVAVHAKPSEGFDQRAAAALAMLRAAAAEFPRAIVQATSLGAEDMVITDLIARHALPIAIGMLDTGQLHDETLALVGRTQRHYGLRIEVWRPQATAAAQFVATHGADAMRKSVELRHACCALRKLEPLSRMLEGRQGWITGMRREQSQQRKQISLRERDMQGRTKLNPLIDWTLGDVWHYISLQGVPYNPLHDRHFPSIGCSPCTRAVAVGEDFRAGRWWWESDGAKECGLHVQRRPASSEPQQSSQRDTGVHP